MITRPWNESFLAEEAIHRPMSIELWLNFTVQKILSCNDDDGSKRGNGLASLHIPLAYSFGR